MSREDWLRHEILRIKAGATIRQRCTMSTPDRLAAGLCLGDVPDLRAHRGQDTCSPECAADKKRLRRWALSRNKCRVCGHGFTKKERAEIEARRAGGTA